MKLSIITVNYNNFDGLKKTAESILTQTWRDFEWIIIDGASTDGSREYIVDLNESLNKNGWNPISYWCSEPDKGIYNAMNKGIFHAKGEYLNFMNSGDTFHENTTLEKVIPFFAEALGDIYYGNANYIYEDREEINLKPENVTFEFIFRYTISHQASFIRKELLIQSEGYDETLKIVSDWKMWLVWMMQKRKFIHIGLIVCDFDAYGISLTNDKMLYEEREKVYEDILPIGLRENMDKLHVYEKVTPYREHLFNYIIEHRYLKSVITLYLNILSRIFNIKD